MGLVRFGTLEKPAISQQNSNCTVVNSNVATLSCTTRAHRQEIVVVVAASRLPSSTQKARLNMPGVRDVRWVLFVR